MNIANRDADVRMTGRGSGDRYRNVESSINDRSISLCETLFHAELVTNGAALGLNPYFRSLVVKSRIESIS